MTSWTSPPAAGRLLSTWGLALVLGLPGLARADYLWLQRQGDQARVYGGALHQPLAQWPALAQAQPVPPAAVQEAADHRSFVPAGSGDLRFSAVRAGADGVLTYFHARYGRQDTQAGSDLELVPTEPGGDRFALVFKGRRVAASQVRVETSEGWQRVLRPAPDGTVGFVPSFPGLYVLDVTVRINQGQVTLDGRSYEDVRHTATLSFEVPR